MSFRVFKMVSNCLTRTCNKQPPDITRNNQKHIHQTKQDQSNTTNDSAVNAIVSLAGTDWCWVPKLTTLFSACTISSLICFKVASLRSRSSSRDILRRRLASRDSSEWACGRSESARDRQREREREKQRERDRGRERRKGEKDETLAALRRRSTSHVKNRRNNLINRFTRLSVMQVFYYLNPQCFLV